MRDFLKCYHKHTPNFFTRSTAYELSYHTTLISQLYVYYTKSPSKLAQRETYVTGPKTYLFAYGARHVVHLAPQRFGDVVLVVRPPHVPGERSRVHELVAAVQARFRFLIMSFFVPAKLGFRVEYGATVTYIVLNLCTLLQMVSRSVVITQ